MSEIKTMADSLVQLPGAKPENLQQITELSAKLVTLGYKRWQDLDSSGVADELRTSQPDKGRVDLAAVWSFRSVAVHPPSLPTAVELVRVVDIWRR